MADFGISKIVGSSQPSYTAHGQIIGTPEYLSPEAVVGEPLDARTDQWSLGIVAYQMLTGRVPFGHRDELTTMLRVRTQALRPLRTLAVDVPRHVSDAIEVALSKRKEDRFATVQDFVRALSGLQPLRSSRRLSSRSRTDADAVPLPISQSNPLPVYVDPDSGPRSAPAPLRSLPPPTLRDAPSMPDQTELAEIVSERNEIAAPLRSAPAEPSVPPAGLATGPAAESPAAALRPAEGRPGWFRQNVRPLQRGLRAASLATVGLLVVGALQDVWHLPQPRLYAAEQGTPWRGSEEPLAGTSRSGRRYLVVPRQDSAPSELAGTEPAVNEGEDEGEDEGEGAGPDPAPGSDSPERRTAPVRADASRHAGRGPSVKNQELSGSARAAAALAQEEPPSEPAPAAAGGNVRAGPEATAPASPRPARPEGPSEPRGAEPRQTEPPGSAGAGARFVESDSAATNLGSAGPRRRFASLERKSGEDPHLLPAVRALYRGQTLQGRYLICVREDGSVESVTVKKAATDTDDEIVTTLKTWRYPPQPAGTLTCTAEILQFEL